MRSEEYGKRAGGWQRRALLLAALVLSAILLPSIARAQVLNPANGHYYQLVPAPGGINFTDAALAAGGMSYQGSSGHLATVTSAAEDGFVSSYTSSFGYLNDIWIGGYQDHSASDYSEPSGGWRWVTGEPWSYTNWNQYEPNNAGVGEDVLEMSTSGGWNDLGDQILVPAYLVEFDGPFLFPGVGLSGTSLSFGSQIVGTTSAAQSVTLTNTGTGPLTISRLSLTGANASSFNLTAGGGGGMLVAGASRTITVTFSPTVAGSDSASIVIVSDAEGSPHSVSLSGSGYIPAPAVSLSPSVIDFGNQSVGTTSAPRGVTLTNTGNLPLSVNSIGLGGANPGSFAIAGGGSGTLAPGSSQSISLTFTPATAGSFSASLIIANNAPGSPHSVSLIGSGGDPAISVSPTGLDFGTVELGQQAVRGVTVTNSGTAPLALTSVSFTGDPDFGLAGGGPSTLAPGEIRTLTISFAPTAVGARAGSLLIGHNAAGSPTTIALTGAGINPPPAPPGTPLSRVSPPAVDFGPQAVGASGGARSVNVFNPGTAPLVVSSVALAGANPGDFHLLSTVIGTVGEGTQRSISVSFAPTGVGARSATLTIQHNATSSPDTVTLIGTGTPGSGSPASTGPPVITGYAATNPRGVRIFSAPPGAPLLILGQNLGTGGTLAFNGIPAPPALSWSPTEIVAIVPAAPSYAFTGPVNATVSGQSATGPPFTITLPKAPAAPSADWPMFMHDPRQLGLADSALDPHTLASWSVPLGSPPASAPVVRGGVAYIGTGVGDILAIDTTTHGIRWQQRLPSAVRAAPAASDTAIVVSAGGLYGLSLADGSILWQRPDIVAAHDIAPMLVDNTVYLGAAGPGGTQRLYAIAAANGAAAWPASVILPAGFEARTPVAAFPELGLLVIGLARSSTADRPSASPGAIMALRLSDGGMLWPAPVPLPASLPPTGLSLGWANGRSGATGASTLQPAVFVVTGSSITAWNAVSGSALWSRELPEAAIVGAPVVSTNGLQATTLLVGGASGHLYTLNSSTGADAPGTPITPTGPLMGALALAGQTVFAPTTAGLVATQTTTGAPIWSSQLSPVTGVVVAGGSPFVATADDRLVGFSPGGVTPLPPAVLHDVAITGLLAPAHVSRQNDATVQVTVFNKGTQPENCKLLVRVQPGRVVIAENALNLAAGETKTLAIPWPTPLMGEDGPKTLVAALSLQGQTDSSPANNEAIQVVIVGP